MNLKSGLHIQSGVVVDICIQSKPTKCEQRKSEKKLQYVITTTL